MLLLLPPAGRAPAVLFLSLTIIASCVVRTSADDSRPRTRLLNEVEHVACQRSIAGCIPAGGCEMKGSQCVPKIGHYWSSSAALPPSPAPWYNLLRFVRPPQTPKIVMTEKGLMQVKFNFWGATFELVDDPGMRGTSWPGVVAVAVCWVLPLFLMSIL